MAGLWFKILAKKYMGGKMEVLLRIMCGGLDVLGVERGVSTRFDSLFSNYLLNMVGNGGNILFWFEPWLYEKLSKDKFSRLLSLAINKHE